MMRRPEELKVHKNRLPYPFCLDMKALRNWINDGSHDETELPQSLLPKSWFSSTDKRILCKVSAPLESQFSELEFLLTRMKPKEGDTYTRYRLKSKEKGSGQIPPGYPALLICSNSIFMAQNAHSEILNVVLIDARGLARRLRFLTVLLMVLTVCLMLTQLAFPRMILSTCLSFALMIVWGLGVSALSLFDILYGLLCLQSESI